MGSEGETTYTANTDGSISVKDADGVETRYAKEADLLAVKGSRDDLQAKLDAAVKDRSATDTANVAAAEVARQEVLKAEAKVTGLEEQIAKGGGTTAELATAKSELETAKKSGEELGNKFLELRRATISQAYGVPRETVDSKDLAALDIYEEALKAVIGQKALGNFAVGGGGGGANPLEGKSPMELAQLAYATK